MSAAIVGAARDLIGVRWRHQGRDPQTGVDCVGLCLFALKAAGFSLPHIPDYPRRHNGSLLLSALQRHLTRVPVAALASGDIGLFQESGLPIHVGILSREGEAAVIHAHARRRKVVEESLNIYGYPHQVFRF